MQHSLQHVACVDDDEDILQIAQLSLEEIGQLKVTAFHGSRSALAGLADAQPDLILMDVMMPGTDGPSALRELAAQEATARIPVVFMTARVQPSEMRQYMALGAAGVISKPFDAITLADELQAIWRNWRVLNRRPG